MAVATETALRSESRDPYTHAFTPRFHEIDGQGVMFNMWYLAYIDETMVGFFADGPAPYSRWVRDLQVDGHVAHVDLDWNASLGPDQPFEVVMQTGRVGGKSFTLEFEFRQAGRTSCVGSIIYVLFATDGSGTVEIPTLIRRALGIVDAPPRAAQV